jgi:hypothetical protein
MLAVMGALKDLWQSERGLVAIALIAATTVLTVTGYITSTQWLEYTKWVFVTYVAAKTVTGAVAIATNPTASTTTATVWQSAAPPVVGAIAITTPEAPPAKAP